MFRIATASARSTFIRRGFCVLLCAAGAACGSRDTTIRYDVVDGYRFSVAEQRLIRRVADATIPDARRLLPALPRELILRFQPGKKVIPETGETGSPSPPNVVYVTLDPDHAGGVSAVVEHQLRPLLFHEFHHLVRALSVNNTSLMDDVVTEGMATAFERDFGGASPLWGAYPDDVSAWVQELQALPPDVSHREWMFQHPDGRRWVGFKAGTYLVDQASRSSGRSSADLVSTSTADIISMALRR